MSEQPRFSPEGAEVGENPRSTPAFLSVHEILRAEQTRMSTLTPEQLAQECQKRTDEAYKKLDSQARGHMRPVRDMDSGLVDAIWHVLQEGEASATDRRMCEVQASEPIYPAEIIAREVARINALTPDENKRENDINRARVFLGPFITCVRKSSPSVYPRHVTEAAHASRMTAETTTGTGASAPAESEAAVAASEAPASEAQASEAPASVAPAASAAPASLAPASPPPASPPPPFAAAARTPDFEYTGQFVYILSHSWPADLMEFSPYPISDITDESPNLLQLQALSVFNIQELETRIDQDIIRKAENDLRREQNLAEEAARKLEEQRRDREREKEAQTPSLRSKAEKWGSVSTPRWVSHEQQMAEGFFIRNHTPLPQPDWKQIRCRLTRFSVLDLAHPEVHNSVRMEGRLRRAGYDPEYCTVFFDRLLDSLITGRSIAQEHAYVLRLNREDEAGAQSDLIAVQRAFNFLDPEITADQKAMREANIRLAMRNGCTVHLSGSVAADAGGVRSDLFISILHQVLELCKTSNLMYVVDDLGPDETYFFCLAAFHPGVQAEIRAERESNLVLLAICFMLCIGCDKLKSINVAIDPLLFMPFFMTQDLFSREHFIKIVMPTQFTQSVYMELLCDFVHEMNNGNGSPEELFSYKEFYDKAYNATYFEGFPPYLDFNGRDSQLSRPRAQDEHDIEIDEQPEGHFLNMNYVDWYCNQVADKGTPYARMIIERLQPIFDAFNVSREKIVDFLSNNTFNKSMHWFVPVTSVVVDISDDRGGNSLNSLKAQIASCVNLTCDERLNLRCHVEKDDIQGAYIPFKFIRRLTANQYHRKGLRSTFYPTDARGNPPVSGDPFDRSPAGFKFFQRNVELLHEYIQSMPNLQNPDDPQVIDPDSTLYFCLSCRATNMLTRGSDESEILFRGKIQDWLSMDKFHEFFSVADKDALKHEIKHLVKVYNGLLSKAKRDTVVGSESVQSFNSERLSLDLSADSTLVSDLGDWFISVTDVLIKGYEKHLSEVEADSKISVDEDLTSDAHKIFPRLQYVCPVKGLGKFCETCSPLHCEYCQFDKQPCSDCRSKDKELLSLKRTISVLAGSKPCNLTRPLSIAYTNNVYPEDFQNGRVGYVCNGNLQGDRQGLDAHTCGNRVDVGPMGNPYTYTPSNPSDAKDFKFNNFESAMCCLHSLMAFLSNNAPGTFGKS
jgi:hypothetical protein